MDGTKKKEKGYQDCLAIDIIKHALHDFSNTTYFDSIVILYCHFNQFYGLKDGRYQGNLCPTSEWICAYSKIQTL